jgi:hypothetical protein
MKSNFRPSLSSGKSKKTKKTVRGPKLATIQRRYQELCRLRERLNEIQALRNTT